MRRSITLLFISALLSQVAFAQKSKAARVDTWVLAQQAFARLEYTNAYKYASDTLNKNPQNVEARRIAAKSAKELERYSDCLRILGGLPVTGVSADDVGLVGECSAPADFSSWTLNFLQQNLNVSANHDMAAYWLGRYYYRKGEYARAEKLLSSVVVLPARLERDRQFMSGRLKDVLRSAPPPQPKQAAAPAPKSTVIMPPRTVVASPSQSAQPAPVIDKPFERTQPEKTAAESRPPRDMDGWFLTPDLSVSAEATSTTGWEIPLDEHSQRAYDDYTSSDPFDPNVAHDKIQSNRLYSSAFSALELRTAATGGYRLGSVDVNKPMFEIGANAGGGVTLSTDLNPTPYYTVRGNMAPPGTRLFDPTRGFGVFFTPETTFWFNRYFGAAGSVMIAHDWIDFKNSYAVLHYDLEADLLLDYGPLHLKPGYVAHYDADNTGATVIFATDNFVDLQIDKTWYVSLRAPKGYPLFRYSGIVLLGLPARNEIVGYNASTGKFIELNLAPRFHVLDSLALLAWYHYLRATNLSYISPGVAAGIEDGSIPNQVPLSATYNSTVSEIIGGIDWTYQRNVSFLMGVSKRTTTSQFVPDPTTTIDRRYQSLFDNAPHLQEDKFILFAQVVLAL